MRKKTSNVQAETLLESSQLAGDEAAAATMSPVSFSAAENADIATY